MKEFYNINEVAKLFNITTNKIRYYEEKGIIKPTRDSESDYRKYSEKDIIRLQTILLYRCIGLSINDIKDILKDDSNKNYINHFNEQWTRVNDEIHKLVDIRESIGNILDNLYNNDTTKINDNILEIIESTKTLNEIRENWKDKWNFDNWAREYDEFVEADKDDLKLYKNYHLILQSVYDIVEKSDLLSTEVLEIGVGTGNLASNFLNKNYNIVGIDQSREMLSVAKEKYPNLKVRIGEFLKIPYDNKSFDAIVSTYAFHHLNQDEKSLAIKEMIRVLKDDGLIVIGDLAFKNKEDKENILSQLSQDEIKTIKDEYYSDIEWLSKEFKKNGKKLEYKRIDNLNYIMKIE